MTDREKIVALAQKVRVLEEENAQLSERAEDSLLLGLIGAVIQDAKKYEDVFDLILERISILKNIPYCTCVRFGPDGPEAIATYAAFSNHPDCGHPIILDDDIRHELQLGNVLLRGTEGIGFKFGSAEFEPSAVVLIPFTSQPVPQGIFVFAEPDTSVQALAAKAPLLQQIVDMAVGRVDNQYLLKALHAANEDLEQRISDRTQALSIANHELRMTIAEKEKSQSALKISQERFVTVLDSIDAQIYVADLETHEILFANQKLKQDCGTDPVGRKCFETLQGESGPRPACTNVNLLDASGKPLGVVAWESCHPVTGVHYMNYDRAIQWVDGRTVRIQIATDISYVKAIESEKKEYEQQLAQARKLEALGTLAGGIAHDFNNLMMGVRGHVSLMLADRAGAGEVRDRLTSIESLVESASRLTAQLLGMSKKGKYDVASHDPNVLIQKSMELYGRTNKEIVIHLDLANDVWPVAVDHTQIEQVVLNLSINAGQAMPKGGDITVRSRNVHLDDALARRLNLAPDRYVRISFTDTGVGIDPSVQEKIFDPFFTTKKKTRGTGLGLASAYGIISNHNGMIDVVSKKGTGSTFTIYLPATSEKPAPIVPMPEEIVQGSGLALLVDDEKIICEVGQSMLEEIGFDVVVAENGKAAIDLFKQHQDQIVIVILDMVMPGMNGGEVYDNLKAIDPKTKVLLSSGYSMDGDARQILARGCNGFIQKPFNLVDLSMKIDAVLKM